MTNIKAQNTTDTNAWIPNDICSPHPLAMSWLHESCIQQEIKHTHNGFNWAINGRRMLPYNLSVFLGKTITKLESKTLMPLDKHSHYNAIPINYGVLSLVHCLTLWLVRDAKIFLKQLKLVNRRTGWFQTIDTPFLGCNSGSHDHKLRIFQTGLTFKVILIIWCCMYFNLHAVYKYWQIIKKNCVK